LPKVQLKQVLFSKRINIIQPASGLNHQNET